MELPQHSDSISLSQNLILLRTSWKCQLNFGVYKESNDVRPLGHSQGTPQCRHSLNALVCVVIALRQCQISHLYHPKNGIRLTKLPGGICELQSNHDFCASFCCLAGRKGKIRCVRTIILRISWIKTLQVPAWIAKCTAPSLVTKWNEEEEEEMY